MAESGRSTREAEAAAVEQDYRLAAAAAIETELSDEYHLVTHPVIAGRGKKLFANVAAPHRLRHLSTRTFPSGGFWSSMRVREGSRRPTDIPNPALKALRSEIDEPEVPSGIAILGTDDATKK